MGTSVVGLKESDLVISVVQNNLQRNVVVVDVNKPALEFFMLDDKSSVVSKPLHSVLDPKTWQMIDDYIEYSDDGRDLEDVVSKIRYFAFLNRNMQPVQVKAKVFRTSSDKNAINYEILIRDVSISQKLNAFRKSVLGPSYRHKIDDTLGILDPKSTGTEISTVLDFSRRYSIDVVLAMASLDTATSRTYDLTDDVYKAFSDAISANLRYTDVVGYAGNKVFAFILLGCKGTSAYSAVSRIHNRASSAVSACSQGAQVFMGYSYTNGTHRKTLVHDTYAALTTACKGSISHIECADSQDHH